MYKRIEEFVNRIINSQVATNNKLTTRQLRLVAFALKQIKITIGSSKNFIVSKLYKYLADYLTPKHFLTDARFAKFKKRIYKTPNIVDLESDAFYENPNNLNKIGKLLVYLELNRLEKVYRRTYISAQGLETNDQLLSVNVFLALYLYTTNLGYKKINNYLRSASAQDIAFCERIIPLINRGVERLSRCKKYQLMSDEHTLIRYLKLPQTILDKIIVDIKSNNFFFDPAFLSTSFHTEGASEFAKEANVKIVIATHGDCRGAKIDGISPFASEGEFLFKPCTKFYPRGSVDSFVTKDVNGQYVINICAVNAASVIATSLTVKRVVNRLRAKAAAYIKTPQPKRTLGLEENPLSFVPIDKRADLQHSRLSPLCGQGIRVLRRKVTAEDGAPPVARRLFID